MQLDRILYKDATLLEKGRHIPLLQWPGKWRGRFSIMDVDALLVIIASAQNIAVCKSTTPHLDAGLDLFASGKVRKASVAGYYCDSFVCENLTKERQTNKTNGGSMVQLNAKTF